MHFVGPPRPLNHRRALKRVRQPFGGVLGLFGRIRVDYGNDQVIKLGKGFVERSLIVPPTDIRRKQIAVSVSIAKCVRAVK